MKLTVVGSAPAWTRRPGAASSCYLVEHGSTRIVLDFGQGSFSHLWQYCAAGDLDAIVVSHMHADHHVDLIPLRHWVRYDNDGRGPLLYGPADLRPKLGEYQYHADFLSDLGGDALAPGAFAIGELTIQAGHVTHIPDSYGFRVASTDGGPGLVYSGDCGEPADLAPLIQPGDTLLSEAALADGEPDPNKIHMNAAQAAGAAAGGGASRLILTHILDRRDPGAARAAAESAFPGPVALAEPGLEVDIR